MAKSNVRFDNGFPQYDRKVEQMVDAAMDNMCDGVVRYAELRVPLKDGQLWGDIRKLKVHKHKYQVRVDSDYAAYQERGMRADGSHVVRNYTSGGTGKDYLKDGLKKVFQGLNSYFKKGGFR